MTTPSPHELRRRGSALIEGVIAVATIGVALGGMALLHRAAIADVNALQAARQAAWTEAMTGCPSEGFSIREVATGLVHGALPLPDAFFPTHRAEGSGSRTGRPGSRTVRIPCNGSLSGGDSDGAGAWIDNLFP
jgi:hypothetical protein